MLGREVFAPRDEIRTDGKAGSGLFEPEVVTEEIQNYRASTDSVGMFIKQNCVKGKDKSSSTKNLYTAYCGWCRDEGIEPLSSSHFGRNLGRKGYTQYRMSTGNGWKGIDLRYEDNNWTRNQVYSSAGHTHHSNNEPQDVDLETLFEMNNYDNVVMG
jgi:phage/plasmid-associated DNA primase